LSDGTGWPKDAGQPEYFYQLAGAPLNVKVDKRNGNLFINCCQAAIKYFVIVYEHIELPAKLLL